MHLLGWGRIRESRPNVHFLPVKIAIRRLIIWIFFTGLPTCIIETCIFYQGCKKNSHPFPKDSIHLSAEIQDTDSVLLTPILDVLENQWPYASCLQEDVHTTGNLQCAIVSWTAPVNFAKRIGIILANSLYGGSRIYLKSIFLLKIKLLFFIV